MSGARLGQEPLEGGAGQRGRGLGVDWCVSNEQTEGHRAEEQVGRDVDVRLRVRRFIAMVAHPQIAKQLGSDGDELLGALLDSMVDAVYAVDDAGVVLFANPAAVSILGYDSESELVGGRATRRSITGTPMAGRFRSLTVRCCVRGRPARPCM
jgi:PAS domain-containing protein